MRRREIHSPSSAKVVLEILAKKGKTAILRESGRLEKMDDWEPAMSLPADSTKARASGPEDLLVFTTRAAMSTF